MSGDKDFEKKVKELDDVYEQLVDSLDLENMTFHYGSWINVFRNEQKKAPYRALSDEKIAALERALADFEAVYEAEKAEAAKMPLSWAEAERLRKVFDAIFREKYEQPPAPPIEH
jgi:tRNA 2-selenouridine synthase SelU